METGRQRLIKRALKFLKGKELNAEILRVNERVVRWKLEHPELVKDDIPI